MTHGDLPERFKAALTALTGSAPDSAGPLGIAVSGGPDSLALLALAAQAYPGAVVAATVDHGLRSESADEARHVAAICDTLGVPHAILQPAEPIEGNLQSAARAARYALLEEWRSQSGAQWIATAHHADDQFETVMMRLVRGSGVDGLSAIRPVNGAVVRPLLAMRKSELEDYLASRGIEPVIDPSNSDARFDRVRMRAALADFPELDPDRLARTVAALRDSSEALQWAAGQLAEKHIESGANGVVLRRDGLPRELLRRLAIRCIAAIDPGYHPRGDALDRMIASLEAGKNCTIGTILCTAETAGNWRFSEAPARKTG